MNAEREERVAAKIEWGKKVDVSNVVEEVTSKEIAQKDDLTVVAQAQGLQDPPLEGRSIEEIIERTERVEVRAVIPRALTRVEVWAEAGLQGASLAQENPRNLDPILNLLKIERVEEVHVEVKVIVQKRMEMRWRME